MELLENIRLYAFVLNSTLFFLLETVWEFKPQTESRWSHLMKNFGIAFSNGIIYGISFAIAADWIVRTTEQMNFGLMNWLNLPLIWEIVLSLVILDLVIYIWHILLHRIPFLWRFHIVHHIDSRLDFSTGTRFHLGELIAMSLFHLPIFFLLGLSFEALILNQALMLVFTQFQHANVQIPSRIDNVLRKIMITTNFHQVHHSTKNQEFNSNYGTVLSCWDYLGKTYNPQRNIQSIETGIQKTPKVMNFRDIMKFPFQK